MDIMFFEYLGWPDEYQQRLLCFATRLLGESVQVCLEKNKQTKEPTDFDIGYKFNEVFTKKIQDLKVHFDLSTL